VPDRTSPALLKDLRRIVGDAAVIDEPDRLMVYESDGLTAYRMRPRAVVLPGSGAEAVQVVRSLASEGVPFVPRGAGTGLSGGALAGPDAVVIGTARMSRILSLDPEARLARVEPGLINARLTQATRPHGLYYAPDPSSQSACSLGGNVAENSGGPHCLKYGVTTRYVSGLKLVLPDGEEVELGGAGRRPDPLDLRGVVVGAEGCFGLVTEIEVRLLPLPEGVRTLLGIFERIEDAGRAVTAIIARGLLPAALEIIDSETIRAVESSVFAAGYPTDAGAALVVEFDGGEVGLDEDVAEAVECCELHGAREVRSARDEEERAALWRGRKKAFGAMGRIAPDLLVQDATVPRTRLPDVLERIGEIGKRYELNVANVFHAGDGNLHPNILFDRRDADELDRVERASKEIMAVCVEAGGTITGEHGVGLDKRQYMELVHDDVTLGMMASVRRVFDPKLMCNPGKVLPDRFWEADAAAEGHRSVRPRELDPASLLGRDRVLDGELDTAPWSTGAGAPGFVLFPASPEEVEAVVRVASEQRWRMAPSGGGTRLQLRGDVTPPDAVLSLRDLEGILSYDPADLTLVAQAGTRLSTLQEALAAEGQLLPFDLVTEGDGTLGGTLATGWSGPSHAAFGPPRDQLLGLRAVSGAGAAISPGGRVVKNVAGYDLTRLIAGSAGRLAIVTEASLRLFPNPPELRDVEVAGPDMASLLEVYLRAAGTGAPIHAAAVISGWGDTPTLMMRIGGRGSAVEDGVRRVREAVGGDHASPGRWGAAVLPAAGRAPVVLRVHAIRTDLPEAARVAGEVLSHGTAPGDTWMVGLPEAEEVRIAMGGGLKEGEGVGGFESIVAELSARLSVVGAAMSIARSGPDLRARLGGAQPDTARRLTESVHRAFDPNRVLSASLLSAAGATTP